MPSPSGGESGAASQIAKTRSRRPNQRKFYVVRDRGASNTHGFVLQNEEALFQGGSLDLSSERRDVNDCRQAWQLLHLGSRHGHRTVEADNARQPYHGGQRLI
jgi:hypothetical protein